MNIVFDRQEQIAPRIWTFYFRPEKPVYYIAGQYAEFYLPHEHDSRGAHRWFTLSSSPTEEFLAVTTKFAPSDSSTFKREMLQLQPGAKLVMTDPMGDFVLPKDTNIPLVFIVGGIGVTPVRSMLQWLATKNERRPIQLLYAARSPQDLVFSDLFAALPINFMPILTNAGSDWQGHTGYLNAERVLELIGDSDNKDTLFYFSGPEPMVEMLVAELKAEHTVQPHQIVLDYFPGYSSL
jgi:ferredoxin-NADP reductase